MRYELLVDGDHRANVEGAVGVRAWIAEYREENSDTDPDAAHVLVRKLSPLAWLTGGKLVPLEQFLD